MEKKITYFTHSLDGDWRSEIKGATTHKTISASPEAYLSKSPHDGPNVNMEAIAPFLHMADPELLPCSFTRLAEALNNLSEKEKNIFRRYFSLEIPYGYHSEHERLLRKIVFDDSGKITQEGAAYFFTGGGTKYGWWSIVSLPEDPRPTEFIEFTRDTAKTFARLAVTTSLLPLREIVRDPTLLEEIEERAWEMARWYYKSFHELKKKIGRDSTVQEFFVFTTDYFEKQILPQLLKSPENKSENQDNKILKLMREYGIKHLIAGDQHPGWESAVKRLSASLELYNAQKKEDPYSNLEGSFEMYTLTPTNYDDEKFAFYELYLENVGLFNRLYNQALDNTDSPISRIVNPDINTLFLVNCPQGRHELLIESDESGKPVKITIASLDRKTSRYQSIIETTVDYEKNTLEITAQDQKQSISFDINSDIRHPRMYLLSKILTNDLAKKFLGERVAISLKAVAALPAYAYYTDEENKKALLLPRFGSSYSPSSAEFLRLLRENGISIPQIHIIRQHQFPYDALGSLDFILNLPPPLEYFLGISTISSGDFSKQWREWEESAKKLLSQIEAAPNLISKFSIMLDQILSNNMGDPEYRKLTLELKQKLDEIPSEALKESLRNKISILNQITQEGFRITNVSNETLAPKVISLILEEVSKMELNEETKKRAGEIANDLNMSPTQKIKDLLTLIFQSRFEQIRTRSKNDEEFLSELKKFMQDLGFDDEEKLTRYNIKDFENSLLLVYDLRNKIRQLQDQLEEEGDIDAFIIKIFQTEIGPNVSLLRKKIEEKLRQLEEQSERFFKRLNSEDKKPKKQKEKEISEEEKLADLLTVMLAIHLKTLESITLLSKANSRQPFATLYMLGGIPLIKRVIEDVKYEMEVL